MIDLKSDHPHSLRVFFATEMWERYGFYVVQSLLALYLAAHFKWNDAHIYALVGSFTALTYLSPILGGMIADLYLGQKRTVFLGVIVLFISYLILSLVQAELTINMTLAGIAVGTGLLKPNISSLLGNQYSLQSPKRESGFTIFYMGLTLGIILGTTLPSQINYYFGWSQAFLSAAFGMIIAGFVFGFGIKLYHIEDYIPFEYSFKKIVTSLGLMLLLWMSAFYILNYPAVADIVFIGAVAGSLIFILATFKKERALQAKQTLVIGLLCLISILFWAFYFQMFLSLTLFISRVVEPKFLGILFPPPYYVSIQSIGMLVLGYFLSKRTPHLSIAQRGILTGRKFLLAITLTSMGYGLIILACHTSASEELLSPLYFIPTYLLLSLAELLLSPVGLSAITFLSGRTKVSTMMGIFFVSLGVGAFIAGKIATITAIPVGETSIALLKSHYTQSFTTLFFIVLIGNIICFGLYKLIKRLLIVNINE